MKNLYTFILLLAAASLFSQNSTLTRTYTTSGYVAGGMYIRSLVHGNALYNITPDAAGIMVQKCDLDGVPVLSKTISAVYVAGQGLVQLKSYGPDLFISGTAFSGGSLSPFLIKLDSASLSVVFSAQYQINNFNYVRINDCAVTPAGEMFMAGSVTNSGSMTNEYGILMMINLNANGSLMNTHTLSVGSNSVNILTSITQISNSTLLFGITAGNQPYIGRAIRSAVSLSVTGIYITSAGGANVAAFGNPKKFLAFNNTSVFKVDTNLTTLGSPQPGATYTMANTCQYIDNRVYRILNNSAMQIVDTSLNIVSTNAYTNAVSSPAFFAQTVTKNANNLFITYSQNQTTNNYYLLKTDPNGQMNCSSSQTGTSSPTATNGGTVAFSSSGITSSSSFTTHAAGTAAVTHTMGCLSVGITEFQAQPKLIIASMNGRYLVKSEAPVSRLSLRDLNGRLIYELKPAAAGSGISFDLSGIASGVYLAEVELENKNVLYAKLLHQ